MSNFTPRLPAKPWCVPAPLGLPRRCRSSTPSPPRAYGLLNSLLRRFGGDFDPPPIYSTFVTRPNMNLDASEFPPPFFFFGLFFNFHNSGCLRPGSSMAKCASPPPCSPKYIRTPRRVSPRAPSLFLFLRPPFFSRSTYFPSFL